MKLTIDDKLGNDQFSIVITNFGHPFYDCLIEIDYKNRIEILEVYDAKNKCNIDEPTAEMLQEIKTTIENHIQEFPYDFLEIQEEEEKDWFTIGCDRYHEEKENGNDGKDY